MFRTLTLLALLAGCKKQPATPPVPHEPDFRVDGWNWVYGAIAQGQSFVALGTSFQSVELRLARLNEQVPEGALVVELRSADLQRSYAQAELRPEQLALEFSTVAVDLRPRCPLETGGEYTLLFTSPDSKADGGWLVNQAYGDLTDQGRDLAGHRLQFDYIFRIAFDNGAVLSTFPEQPAALPVNSGAPGGGASSGPLNIQDCCQIEPARACEQ